MMKGGQFRIESGSTDLSVSAARSTGQAIKAQACDGQSPGLEPFSPAPHGHN
jgi:hypothetical protein